MLWGFPAAARTWLAPVSMAVLLLLPDAVAAADPQKPRALCVRVEVDTSMLKDQAFAPRFNHDLTNSQASRITELALGAPWAKRVHSDADGQNDLSCAKSDDVGRIVVDIQRDPKGKPFVITFTFNDLGKFRIQIRRIDVDKLRRTDMSVLSGNPDATVNVIYRELNRIAGEVVAIERGE